MLMSTLWNRTFRELSKAEEQLSLCRELCEDLADDLKRENLKVGCSVLVAALILPEPTEESLSYGLSFSNIFSEKRFNITLVWRELKGAPLWLLTECPWLRAESHTITTTCSVLCESIGLDGSAWPSPPRLGSDVALIAWGNGGPLRRQQGLLSALEMSLWEMITLLWKPSVASFPHNAFRRINHLRFFLCLYSIFGAISIYGIVLVYVKELVKRRAGMDVFVFKRFSSFFYFFFRARR